EVAALAIGEDECLRWGPTLGEVEFGELARDRREQLRLARAVGLRRRELLAGDGAVDAQATAWAAAIVEDVFPAERVGLARPQALVREHTDERGVLAVEL